jgi:putative acetyltransferase
MFVSMYICSMNIYRGTQAHHREIMNVWEASVRETHDFLTEADIVHYKELIGSDYINQLSLYCTKQDGRITGFIGLSDGMVQMLFIAPTVRGRGIGKRLLQYAIDEHGINQVDVNEQNQQALDFYRYMGFEVTSRTEVDGAGKPYPILKMHLL